MRESGPLIRCQQCNLPAITLENGLVQVRSKHGSDKHITYIAPIALIQALIVHHGISIQSVIDTACEMPVD
jgi:hypothetical protein